MSIAKLDALVVYALLSVPLGMFIVFFLEAALSP